MNGRQGDALASGLEVATKSAFGSSATLEVWSPTAFASKAEKVHAILALSIQHNEESDGYAGIPSPPT